MLNHTTLLGLHAHTSIAAGTGQNLGAIDLPIMREAPTGYPVIFGSALKGAMRAKFESELGAEAVKVYFGDDSKGGSTYAGALIVTDARLALLPVRSMSTHFKWVTCPYILERLRRDMQMLRKEASWSIPNPEKEEALVANDETELYLEEFFFKTQKVSMDGIIETLSSLMEDANAKARLKTQLVVVSDDMFNHLSRFGTPINAHIAIDNETKTVKNGQLWYEETLPAETLLYAMLIAQASRKEGDREMQAGLIKCSVTGHLKTNSYLQVGGNETVGMGWCKVVCHG